MQTPEFLSILNPLSKWLTNNKTILGLLTVVFISAFNYFASAQALQVVEQDGKANKKQIKIQELRYHIDLLSSIPENVMLPAQKRVLEDYIKEKDSLLAKPSFN